MLSSRVDTRNARGFTLLEIVFALALLAIVVRYAVPKIVPPGALTLQAQAQAMADFVRRAQSLAMSSGQRMSVTVATSGSNGTLAIACTTGSTPCSTDSSLKFQQDVSLSGGAVVYFNTMGLPVDSAGAVRDQSSSFTLSHTLGTRTTTFTVTVAALTGRVSVSP